MWHRVTAVARLPAGIRNKEKEERREKRRKERNKQAADDATRAVARAAVKQSQQEAGRQKEQAQAAQAETEAAAAAAAAAKKKPEGATAMSHEAGRRQQTEANAEEAAYANEKRRQLQNLLAILVRIITQREAFLRWKAAAAEDKEKELVFKNVWKVAADMATMQKIMRGVDKMRQNALFDKWKQSKQSNADEPDKNATAQQQQEKPNAETKASAKAAEAKATAFRKTKTMTRTFDHWKRKAAEAAYAQRQLKILANAFRKAAKAAETEKNVDAAKATTSILKEAFRQRKKAAAMQKIMRGILQKVLDKWKATEDTEDTETRLKLLERVDKMRQEKGLEKLDKLLKKKYLGKWRLQTMMEMIQQLNVQRGQRVPRRRIPRATLLQ